MHSEEVVSALAENYRQLDPLLRYLKARLKYDTTRWLRTYGTKDDIVFSTRTKSFARVYDKMCRREIRLAKNTDILDLVLSEKSTLSDLIRIRFICFDTYNIFKLVRYFLVTERVTTSKREFYASSSGRRNTPVAEFLRSNGFRELQKEGRDYEDINFILRFAHPIDTYFGSGAKRFQSLAEMAGGTEPASGRLRQVNQLFEVLRTERPELIQHIPQFPIECQIVTATQHVYNRVQRPQYEHVLQRRPGLAPAPP